VVSGRHHLFLFEYDFGRIKAAIQGIVDRASGETWSDVATQIARYGQWEFEDYEPRSS
jgi:hypothetical protein